MNNLALNGRIEDIAVARDQKGKKMGLRILEALVHISCQAGSYKVSLSNFVSRFLLTVVDRGAMFRSQ